MELKTCPFCGGNEMVLETSAYENGRWATVRCFECGGNIRSDMFETWDEAKADAIEKWNRRADNG